MMLLEQYILGKLAEEASEIAQIALKTQQFGMLEQCPGMGQTNAERIYAELNDLLAILDMLRDTPHFCFQPDIEAIEAKKVKVNKYMLYSVSLGKVNNES